jgi:EAL domain-containing protein (putative c-di-GMP-specific phosphodiesterase class I)
VKGRVLVADDEADLREIFADILAGAGHAVAMAADGASALQALAGGDFDLVLSDIRMPGFSGIDFLRRIHEHDPDLPVIMVTGQPTLETAIEALEHGAIHYLVKPVSPAALREAVQKGLNLHRVANLRKEALEYLTRHQDIEPAAPLDEGALLSQAVRAIWMAYQPIVRSEDGTVFGYEALLRTAEPRLPDPGAVFGAAERLGRVWDVDRAVRDLVAVDLRGPGQTRFLNLHPLDLQDDQLFDPEQPLSRKAGQIVLEITERASLGPVPEIRKRVRELRALGYRIAVDDLGAGYAGLSTFAALEPDIVKLDMSLVRKVDQEAVKRKLVSSMKSLCEELGIIVVAEGVETDAERQVLTDLGCDLLQGYLFGRPAVLAQDAA